MVGSRSTQSQIIWVSGAQFTTFSSEEHSCPHKQTYRHTEKRTHTYTNMQTHTHTLSLSLSLSLRLQGIFYCVHFHWADCRTSARLETAMPILLDTTPTVCCVPRNTQHSMVQRLPKQDFWFEQHSVPSSSATSCTLGQHLLVFQNFVSSLMF